MNTGVVVNFRKATKDDIGFLSLILVNSAVASGVEMQIADLPVHPDTYQYVEGFPKGADTGIVAQTNEGVLVGAAWVRLLPTATHAINEPLPELTMGVISEYQRMGIGNDLWKSFTKQCRVWASLKYH